MLLKTIHSLLLKILDSPVLVFGTLFLFRVCLWAPLEYLWHARSLSYRRVAAKDFAAEVFHVFLVVPIVLYIYNRIPVVTPFNKEIIHAPLLVRILLYFLVADFGYYWAHRLMHTRHLWRTHKWHHSPRYMYWLAGCRATIPHQFFVMTPFILAAPILYPAAWWIYTANALFSYIVVDWMHLNVAWGSRRLEWFFITPRYHHVHHSTNPAHYNRNMGNMFTFWDRLFGTHVDPGTLNAKEIAFGIDDEPSPVRLIAGL